MHTNKCETTSNDATTTRATATTTTSCADDATAATYTTTFADDTRDAAQQAKDELLAVQLAAAKEGDAYAFASLLQDYTPLLIHAAHLPHLRTLVEEALDTARVSFWLAVREYDPTRGIPFPAWARAKVYGDLFTLFKRERRRWNRELFPADFGDGEGDGFWARRVGDDDPARAVCDDAAFHARIACLSERAQTLLRLLFQFGMREGEAASVLGISRQAANALKKRSLQKLRDMMKRD